MLRSALSSLVLPAALTLGAGCAHAPSPAASSFEAAPLPPPTTTVWGLAWDPEILFAGLSACGPECKFPPVIVDGNPLYARARIQGADVRVLDSGTQQEVARADAPSSATGMWKVPGLAQTASPPLFVFSRGGQAVPDDGETKLPPVPAAHYLPTLALKPVYRKYSYCVATQGPLASDAGALEAVARHLTAQGTPTRVEDFLDPSKWRGASLWVLFQPTGYVKVEVTPAAGVTVQASGARVFNLDWKAPGSADAAVKPSQSRRGFYVTDAATSPIGLVAVLVPASAPAAPLTGTVKDPTTEPARGRPYKGELPLRFVDGAITLVPLFLDATTPIIPQDLPETPFGCDSPPGT